MKPKAKSSSVKNAEKIAALTRTLRETERELHCLTGGQPDAVVGAGGGPYLLREAQERMQHSEVAQRQLVETQAAILDALPAHIALVDPDGVIICVNEAWRRFASANVLGSADFGVGQNYLTLCDQATGSCSEEAHAVAAGLRAVLGNHNREFAIEYPCHGPNEPRWFRLMVTPLHEDQPAGAVITHFNITERKLAELEKQKLAHELGERVKELRALHGVADLMQGQKLTTTELLARVAALLPAALQYPEVAAARVGYGGVERTTASFQPSAWGLRADFTAAGALGRVEVVYLTEPPAAASGLFLPEEQNLIQSLADMLRAYFERCAAEAALRASEASMAVAQRIAHFGSWELELTDPDINANPLRWSDEMFRIAGYEPGSVPVSNELFFRLVPPDDHQLVQEAMAAAIRERGSYAIVHRLIRPGGEARVVHEVAQIFFDELTGQPLKMVGTAHDITDQRRFERQVTAFAALGAKLGAAASAEEAARIIVETADDLFGWDACWLHLYDADKESQSVLNIDIVNGRREAVPPAYEGTAPSPMIRRVLNEGAQLILREEPVVDPAQLVPFGDTARPSASLMIVPVRYGGKVIAVLSIQSYTVHAYRPEDLKALEALADHCGGTLARIRAHAARLESEERYRALFDRSRDAVYLHDLEGRFVDANPTALQLLGYQRDDITRLQFADLLADPADIIRARQSIALKLAGDSTEGITTYQLKHQDGTRLWVELTSTLVLANGRPVAIQGIARDTTDRVRAEQALRESEARFQAFMHDSPTVAFMKDAAGHYAYANAALLKLFRVTLDELLGHTDFELLTETVARQLRANDQHVLATNQPLQTIEHVPNEAGEMRTWQVWKFPFHDDVRGRGVGGLAFDITERQRAEERIAEQAALLDAAHEAILVKDLDDRIVFWNKGAERLYGWTATEVLGRTSRELLVPDPAVFQTANDHLMQHGEWHGEMTKRTKAGGPVQIEVRWTLVRDPAGEPKSVLAFNTDITEKKQFEAHFLRAQRMESIGTLAGGIAHDLNNVLAPILMAVQLLQESAVNEEARMLLGTLEQSAQRGADLVKQVLAFARGVEGQRVHVNPIHIVRDIKKIIQDTFPRNLEFKLEAERDLWMVSGDPTQLHQVLMNLCVNARDATPDGGKLTITLGNRVIDEVYAGMNPDSRPGEYLMIQVTDTGIGMSAEVRQKIFEPFFTTKEVGKGTGLGLSTTLAIVKSHGGFINVYSEVGKGTKFKVYLPAQTTPKAVEATAIEQTQLPRGQGELILVVDDEESIRSVARKTLERFGYRVLLAIHGAEAIAIYAQHRAEIAAVLTDMAMPVMDGPATIIALKAMNPNVKIIGSSGLASNDGVTKLVGAGVQRFVPKPYTAEVLLKALRHVLDEPPSGAPGHA